MSKQLEEIVMGVEDASELWNLSAGHIKNLCAAGEVKAIKIGKTWVIEKNQKHPSKKVRKEEISKPFREENDKLTIPALSVEELEAMTDKELIDFALKSLAENRKMVTKELYEIWDLQDKVMDLDFEYRVFDRIGYSLQRVLGRIDEVTHTFRNASLFRKI